MKAPGQKHAHGNSEEARISGEVESGQEVNQEGSQGQAGPCRLGKGLDLILSKTAGPWRVLSKG